MSAPVSNLELLTELLQTATNLFVQYPTNKSLGIDIWAVTQAKEWATQSEVWWLTERKICL